MRPPGKGALSSGLVDIEPPAAVKVADAALVPATMRFADEIVPASAS